MDYGFLPADASIYVIVMFWNSIVWLLIPLLLFHFVYCLQPHWYIAQCIWCRYMYMYEYVYVHVYMYVYVYVYVCMCMHMRIYMRLCLRMRMRVHMHMHMHYLISGAEFINLYVKMYRHPYSETNGAFKYVDNGTKEAKHNESVWYPFLYGGPSTPRENVSCQWYHPHCVGGRICMDIVIDGRKTVSLTTHTSHNEIINDFSKRQMPLSTNDIFTMLEPTGYIA